MSTKLRSFLILNLVLAASACYADTLTMTFTALPSTYMDSQYSSSASDATYNGYVNTTIAGIPNQYVICDDFATDQDMPATYTFDSTAFGSAGWSSAVKFTSTAGYSITNGGSAVTAYGVTIGSGATETLSQTQAYELAAVLLTDFNAATPGLSGTALSHTITDYQYALWYLFENNLTVDGTNEQLNNNSFADLFTAYALVTSTSSLDQDTVAADASSLVIYDDVPKSAGQEFLGLDTPVGTPEPGAWMLAGLGLMGLFTASKIRNNRLGRN